MTVVWVALVGAWFCVGVLGWAVVAHPPAQPATIVAIVADAFAAGLAAGVLLRGED